MATEGNGVWATNMVHTVSERSIARKIYINYTPQSRSHVPKQECNETTRCACVQEFEAWLREVKKIADFNGPKYELKNLFKEFAEDYNTVTLPHKKYVTNRKPRPHPKSRPLTITSDILCALFATGSTTYKHMRTISTKRSSTRR